MKEMILNHMNKDHNDSVVMYAEYFGKEKDVKKAELLDFNEEYMEIKINDEKVIQISFGRTVPLAELKDIMIEMSREARKNLGR